MPPRFLSPLQYQIAFILLFVAYGLGLFVPLMDNDAAHHAAIALHMYRTGDYVDLVDRGLDYLDKPHLHFWLAAFSYHLFGVTAFAYKLPSFLFTIAGTYATYRLGKALYNAEVGKGAALIAASAFAYMLSNNDVRMDAILTACVALATWQLVAWVQQTKWSNVLGASLALAAGFCTKGHIAVFTPGLAVLFYIAYTRRWSVLWRLQFLSLIVLFFVFISPVVYCYYLQYDLYPEKVVRGQQGRSGVQFILWKQNVERFEGEDFGGAGKNDYLFFMHSFLWAFAPWSLLAYAAFITHFKSFWNRKWEWLTIGTFTGIGLLISFSGFKLPHYLNIIFPVAAVLAAAYLAERLPGGRSLRRWWVVQCVLCSLLLLAAAVLNAWFFPVQNGWILLGFLMLLALCLYLFRSAKTYLQRIILLPVVTMTLVFYLLNSNFYPQLLRYQAGNQLAHKIKGKVDPATVWYWRDVYSSSFEFNTATLHGVFSDSLLQQPGPVWLLVDNKALPEVEQKHYRILETITQPDYEITRLKLAFLNPATRGKNLDQLLLLRLK